MMEQNVHGSSAPSKTSAYRLPTIDEIMTMSDIAELDKKSWGEKFEYAARVAQPILDRELPERYPSTVIKTPAQAAGRVLAAAVHMMTLCGFGSVSDEDIDMTASMGEGGAANPQRIYGSGRTARRVAAIVEWRDIWTHPEFYNRVYSDWIGTVYHKRSEALEAASKASQMSSREGPRTARGAYWINDALSSRVRSLLERRGPPDSPEGTLGAYQHPPPERFGHPTSLVHITETTSGAERQALLKRSGASYTPSTVLRLSSVEWYIKGFLPSVLVWAHLSMVEAKRVMKYHREREQADPVISGGLEINISLYHLIAKASGNRVFKVDDGGNVELDAVFVEGWQRLEPLIDVIRKDWLSAQYDALGVLTPSLNVQDHELSTTLVPDMIRIPQELWYALSKRREVFDHKIRISGMKGAFRWGNIEKLSDDTLWEYTLAPGWVHTKQDDAERVSKMEMGDADVDGDDDDDARTKMLELHRENMDAAYMENTRMATRGMGGFESVPDPMRFVKTTEYLRNVESAHRSMLDVAYPPPERYFPLLQPPHPVPALYIPWTFAAVLVDRGTGARRVFEAVIRLESVRSVEIKYLGVPCLETGLALEEWGSSWNGPQRKEHASPPTHDEIVRDVRMGQSVRGVDIDYTFAGAESERLVFLRDFRAHGMMVLDPDGPMGSGHRLYSIDNPIERADPETPNWPRPWSRPLSEAWLRFDRMRTVEYLSIEPPSVDDVGRWEDSGIEMPAEIVRDGREDRPLRFFKADHITKPDSSEVMREYERGLFEWTPGIQLIASVLWEQSHWQFRSRTWTPTRIEPWPPYVDLRKIDVGTLDTESIARAPVIRQLMFRHVLFPRPTWMRELLEYPIGTRDMVLNTTPEQWMRFLEIHNAPPSLMPSARTTLFAIGVDEVVRYAQSVSQVLSEGDGGEMGDFGQAIVRNLLPGVPLPARKGALDRAYAHSTRFRHYPNASAISLARSNLVDIPWGVLDIWISGTYNIPPIRPGRSGASNDPFALTVRAERVDPPPVRVVLCDLSVNRIAQFSTLTWVSLVLLVKTRYDKIAELRRNTRSMPKDKADHYMQQIVVNLYGNPIVDRARAANPTGGADPFMSSWGPYVRTQLDVIADKYRREIAAAPSADETCCPASTAMRFWESHRRTVLVYLREMFVIEKHMRFRRHIVEYFQRINMMRNLWMI